MADKPGKLVFAHHPCIDGVAAMWSLHRKFGEEDTRFIGMNYMNCSAHSRQVETEVAAIGADEPLDIYFLDYLPNDTGIIQKLLDGGHKVHIFDHHHTAERNIAEISEANADNPNLNIVFRHERPTAIIAWEEMFPGEPVPQILQLIERMDLLDLQNQNEEKAAVYIDGFDLSEKQLENLALLTRLHEELERDGLEIFAGQGSDEWQRQVNQVSEILKHKTSLQIGFESFPAIRVGDITELGRFGVKWASNELISPEEPIGLMVKQTPHVVTLNVRVHPERSDETYDIVENLKAAAASVATAAEKEQISGGGRGLNGQLGQGAIRMPTAVAAKLGVIEQAVGKSQELQR